MRISFWMRRGLGLVVVGVAVCAGAQQSIAITEPATPLLPTSFGEWKAATGGAAGSLSLANVSKDALEECGPVRSAVADYARGGKTIHVEAIQFGDRTGAFSAFTLVSQPGIKAGHALGANEATADDAVLFTAGSTVVLASGIGAGEAGSLKPLVEVLPKVAGNKGVAPLLPTMVPAKGLVEGSVRYALGPATYQAEGGVLPAVRRQARQGDAYAAAVSHAGHCRQLRQGREGLCWRRRAGLCECAGAARGGAGDARRGQLQRR